MNILRSRPPRKETTQLEHLENELSEFFKKISSSIIVIQSEINRSISYSHSNNDNDNVLKSFLTRRALLLKRPFLIDQISDKQKQHEPNNLSWQTSVKEEDTIDDDFDLEDDDYDLTLDMKQNHLDAVVFNNDIPTNNITNNMVFDKEKLEWISKDGNDQMWDIEDDKDEVTAVIHQSKEEHQLNPENQLYMKQLESEWIKQEMEHERMFKLLETIINRDSNKQTDAKVRREKLLHL